MVIKRRGTRIPLRHIASFYSTCHSLQSLLLFSVMINNNNSLLREHFLKDKHFQTQRLHLTLTTISHGKQHILKIRIPGLREVKCHVQDHS